MAMSFRGNRKSTPGVRRGKVQKKNRTARSPSVYTADLGLPLIHRQRPGPGCRHLLRKREIERFIALLPDWAELSRGLRVILLAAAEDGTDGWCERGVVAVCAWERELWQDYEPGYFAAHRAIFGRLGVPHAARAGGVRCQFTEETARAYQLLHILLHELGHHHDRMTTRSQIQAARGEPYA
jgi:hypothetical protein